MGAALSLPFLALPSLGTVATFAASCCGAATCSAVCKACGKCQNSLATRIAYALILLVNSIVSWIMLTDWAIKKLEGVTLEYMKISCNGKDCYGYVAVHRINFALGVFHAIMALILLGVRSSRDGRAPIQNGFWGPKIIAWIGLVVVSFLIPDGFFLHFESNVALIGAILFTLIGLILLVDLAHTWAEYCLEKIENSDNGLWRILLIGSTIGMYIASITMTIIMYVYFAHSGCSMNQAAITINLLLLLAISILSIHPTIQASNSRAGLAQAATVAIYCSYLTLSAVAMEPDDSHCNPLVRSNRGARKATIILGAIVTFVTCAYTTTRAATYGLALGSKGTQGYAQLAQGDEAEHGLVTQQPRNERREMRAEALRAAVESGALPASALDDSDDESDDDDHAKHARDDERQSTQYNYSLFHIIFLLATCWIASLLTQGFDGRKGEDFVAVGRTYWASWVKIVSAWICYAIFGWSLAAPAVLPDRFDY